MRLIKLLECIDYEVEVTVTNKTGDVLQRDKNSLIQWQHARRDLDDFILDPEKKTLRAVVK